MFQLFYFYEEKQMVVANFKFFNVMLQFIFI